MLFYMYKIGLDSLVYLPHDYKPVAKFTVPDWGGKVDSGIGLSYRHAGLHRLEDRYDSSRSRLYPLFRDHELSYRDEKNGVFSGTTKLG
jgi:hypothetical protein